MKMVLAAQAWFWTKSWQSGERQASEEIASGQLSGVYENIDEMLTDLEAGALFPPCVYPTFDKDFTLLDPADKQCFKREVTEEFVLDLKVGPAALTWLLLDWTGSGAIGHLRCMAPAR